MFGTYELPRRPTDTISWGVKAMVSGQVLSRFQVGFRGFKGPKIGKNQKSDHLFGTFGTGVCSLRECSEQCSEQRSEPKENLRGNLRKTKRNTQRKT